MARLDIDVASLRAAVNAVLDHLIEDLKMQTVKIDHNEDLYWRCANSEAHDVSNKPMNFDVGRLSDDVDFVQLIQRGQSGDISYNLVHIAPLLRYIGEKVKK